MMVIFVSRSEKKSLYTVRRILDSFADRIGTDTWQTVITAEGLLTVKILLRRSATKSTAVSCHWIRSRSRSELVWIVGNRNKFNAEGIVPVNTTKKNILHGEWENGWQYLPLLKALAALAGLLHDWGKCSDLFQEKLRNSIKQADPFRHEWVSCKLIRAVVKCAGSDRADDSGWLSLFIEDKLNIDNIKERVKEDNDLKDDVFVDMPPIASILIWLILSHHRLPLKSDAKDKKRAIKSFSKVKREKFSDMIKSFNASWSYANLTDENNKGRKKQCFTFSSGLLFDSSAKYRKQLKKWSSRLLENRGTLQKIMIEPKFEQSFRLLLEYARLCLMIGDHYSSSLEVKEERDWADKKLWANTKKRKKKDEGAKPKQSLEEHVLAVSAQAVKIAHQLPRFCNSMERADDIKFLQKKSPKQFRWQDNVVEKIKMFRREHVGDRAYFVVNMASTGCGKTIANAKIMRAIADDEKSLRYILALGLRSLTLQTGDEYRDRIGLKQDELAVLIGSSAVKELHEQDKAAESGSESIENLLDDDLDYIDSCTDEQATFLDLFFAVRDKKNHLDNKTILKNKAFLYKPVLVATIDHLIRATEITRGGKYMLPFLRMMSSDLVIDEIDDFTKRDLLAISRLVHLAGMFGRNVAISSATIPPDLADGMCIAYQEGLAAYNSFFTEPKRRTVVFCDEFSTKIIDNDDKYQKLHEDFINKRVEHLQKEPVKRKGFIADCPQPLNLQKNKTDERNYVQLEKEYFNTIRKIAEKLHADNFVRDQKTNKKVSFGLIRMANINPCVELSVYLLKCDWEKDYEVRLMTYHSREILLLRHNQEAYLDRVLKRKYEYETKVDFKDKRIRECIDNSSANNIIFLVVATPVEEIGRDHDFDWAIIEPSSYRSIIQLVGRILRHRLSIENDIEHYNVAVMRYNLRGLKEERRAFRWPGYEVRAYTLISHDLRELLVESQLNERIDAVPRIKKAAQLNFNSSLIDLEQKTMEDFNNIDDTDENGPRGLHGWLKEYWWMTGLPQYFNRFRGDSADDIKIYRYYKDETVDFYEYENGELDTPNKEKNINHYDGLKSEERLWLKQDYLTALREQAEQDQDDIKSTEEKMTKASIRFGEITMLKPSDSDDKDDTTWLYCDQLGLFKKTDFFQEKEE